MKIAICDDTIEEVKITKQIIEQWAIQNNVAMTIDTFYDGDSLITKNEKEHYDIVFLDIIMPLLNGIDTAIELRNNDQNIAIAFLTTSQEYALASYNVKAKDYCLKPVDPTRLAMILDECQQHLKEHDDKLLIKVNNTSYHTVHMREIDFIEAQNKYVIFHLFNQHTIKVRASLATYEEQLAKQTQFYKCHRSYIVNMHNIDYFDTHSIVTKSSLSIPIARGSFEQFKQHYFDYMFNQ
ncbi:MAG: response regulator transcription factor [Erysipelotrichia bacterium]|nr:response regulator transcription factor [Erysipelotrichia bacterium]NCC54592.1 response regulator transcription factor [Erysipelotrichia bacterium]